MTKGVYFIGIVGRKNLFKIGVSKNCEKRIKQLQTGNPDKLYIYRIEATDQPYILESMLHRKYKSNHYNEGGGTEWFNINKKTIDSIAIERTKRGDYVVTEVRKKGFVSRIREFFSLPVS